MGTTLAHGIYLPSEGERNCYAGLKVNWETLDQKVADISALQSAIAGALHREIVVSLPTTDIDTATIYMILNGTSATENIYDEYMYISNAWELIGTSATDLTNYYTKGEVDSKLLLKASASDLTSHTGDTTIHVTASDKEKWNTLALIKHLRLVNAQVGSATTIPFSDFDDTNGIKVGDKCADLDVKVFEITAVDTANQTVTVSSALIDIALDANVVHTSGNETVGGQKTFSDNLTIYNSDSSQPTKNLNISSSKIQVGDTSNQDSFGISFNAGASYASQIMAFKDTSATQNLQITVRTKDGSENLITSMVRLRLLANGSSSFVPGTNNFISLGVLGFKWKDVNTYLVNGVTPSSLGLPDLDNAVDISGYVTDLTGGTNNYTPSDNGYISLCAVSSTSNGAFIKQGDFGASGRDLTISGTRYAYVFLPVAKNVQVDIVVVSNSLDFVKFYPCLGNV